MLREAKTISVVGNTNPALVAELTKELLKWGKPAVLSQSSNADLLLQVVQTSRLDLGSGSGAQASAVLLEPGSGTQLWSLTKGGGYAMSGFSYAWVGRAIGKDLVKFLDLSATRGSPNASRPSNRKP